LAVSCKPEKQNLMFLFLIPANSSSSKLSINFPSSQYSPLVGMSSAPRICIRVDLPDPDGPIMAANSPFFDFKRNIIKSDYLYFTGFVYFGNMRNFNHFDILIMPPILLPNGDAPFFWESIEEITPLITKSPSFSPETTSVCVSEDKPVSTGTRLRFAVYQYDLHSFAFSILE